MRLPLLGLACLLTTAGRAAAQIPAIRPLGEPVAQADSIPLEPSLRVLSDGRLLVLDTRSGWVGLYASTLKSRQALVAGRPDFKYGTASLLPYLNDTTLMVDVTSA